MNINDKTKFDSVLRLRGIVLVYVNFSSVLKKYLDTIDSFDYIIVIHHYKGESNAIQ